MYFKSFLKIAKLNVHLAVSFSFLTGLLIIGTVAYHFLEDWTWIESLYFTVTTLATVGYGDLHPTNTISRLFTIGFILFGVTSAIAALGYIGSQNLAQKTEMLIQKRESSIQKQQKGSS